MTTGSELEITSPISARVFLFGEHSEAALRDRLADGEVLAEVRDGLKAATVAARQLLDRQLAPIANSFIDIDLGATAVAGWQRHQRLRAAAQETLASPGQVTIVDLASHRLTATWQPRVEIDVGRRTVAHLTFDLAIAFDVVGLAALVEHGRLMRLGGGRCRVEASFCLGGQTLASRSAQFHPAVALPLGSGVPLARGVADPAAATTTAP